MQQPFLARMSQASFVTSVHELCEGRMRTDEVFAVHWKLAQGGSAVSFASPSSLAAFNDCLLYTSDAADVLAKDIAQAAAYERQVPAAATHRR